MLAHGFGLRYDLPVPLYYYLVGGAAVVVITFVVLGAFVRRRGAEEPAPYLPLPAWAQAVAGSPVPRLVGGALGIAVLVGVLITGFAGAADATSNPAEYLVWIYFWAGLVVVSGLVGNLYAVLNPWSALYDLAHWVLRRPVGRGIVGYPARLGIWPAVAGYLMFAWLELASGLSARPRYLAAAALAYSIYTLVMLHVVGRDRWLARGEFFSVLFRFVGAFGPVEVRARNSGACAECSSRCESSQTSCVDCGECFRTAHGREIGLRPWSVGLLRIRAGGWDVVAFVILTLSSLAFDGISATPGWARLVESSSSVTDSLGAAGPVLLKTLGLVATTLLFLGIFAAVMRLTVVLGGAAAEGMRVTTRFAITLVPIALVYNAAHNYSYLIIQGQGLWPLLADPLHNGAHLLPTSDYKVSFALANARTVWYLQVTLIVVGHMLAVFLAHVRSLHLAPRVGAAIRGQLPMLGLMVVYTMTSLWILAQPITEAG